MLHVQEPLSRLFHLRQNSIRQGVIFITVLLISACTDAVTAGATDAATEISSADVSAAPASASTPPDSRTGLIDDARLQGADGDTVNWLSHGRTADEQRFSPLDQINRDTVQDLSLAWSWDTQTNRGLEATPLVADGVMYSTGTWSVAYAHNAQTGELLWQFDPGVARTWGYNACCDVVNRGVALWQDLVIYGTLDGRLIALDAATGSVRWETLTIDPTKPYTITGAPRIFNGQVIIGNGGAELGVRGYVTAYNARTGQQNWRFYTVPGDPAKPFENAALEKAAKTWRGGKWWEVGGGGTAWDAFAFDPALNFVYVGVGNGSPWSRYTRSPGGGDNLYLASILALDAASGNLVWHYQTTPGDNWDYTAVQQMILADLDINGEVRKVIMQAPKNGFFFVLDRVTGQFISAASYVPVSWASHVDPESGRPVENPSGQYLDQPQAVHPGPAGGHNWHPMSFSPRTGLVYMPVTQNRLVYAQERNFAYNKDTWNTGIDFEPNSEMDDGFRVITKLVAWDPLTQSPRWTVNHDRAGASGVLATAGDLVFQPGSDCSFAAYDAVTGAKLWETETQMGTIAGPISYAVDGEQYVAFMAGWGGAAGLYMSVPCRDGHNLMTSEHQRATTGRILAFKLGGKASLPPPATIAGPPPPPARLTTDTATLEQGAGLYRRHCAFCHAVSAELSGVIPNLTYATVETHAAWDAIVLGGAKSDKGMVSFAHLLSQAEAQMIRAHVIEQAHVAQQTRAELASAKKLEPGEAE